MTNGKCPKCDNGEPIHIPGSLGPAGSGNHILMKANPVGAIPVTRYVCMNCGYTEEWIDDLRDRLRLEKQYG